MDDALLRDSLKSLRKHRDTDGDYPLVAGAIAPVLQAIDEFTPDSVALIRESANQLAAGYTAPCPMAARALTVIAAHIEKLLPSAEMTLVAD